MDVSTLERSVLLLKMSTQGPELHLDVSGQQWPVLLLDLHIYTAEACAPLGPVYTLRPELYLDASTLQSPVLNLVVSTPNRT
jgi:hypothetical protein